MKWAWDNLHEHIIRNIVPIITCKPWKPVGTKNVEPYTESERQNGACRYSNTWHKVNTSPNKQVKFKPRVAQFFLPLTILWWAQVTVTPELNKIIVFNKGTENGSNASIPTGGQHRPTSTAGDKLLWKKPQKKETKNKISEIINIINPIFKPQTTVLLW